TTHDVTTGVGVVNSVVLGSLTSTPINVCMLTHLNGFHVYHGYYMHLLFVHPGYFMRHLQAGVDTRRYIQNFRTDHVCTAKQAISKRLDKIIPSSLYDHR
ncbi:MAG: hypothetical protein LBF20_24720, partial [Paenibacillus polymyxa]|nr:hypothetical protein [Paenibacillus polymyxa]